MCSPDLCFASLAGKPQSETPDIAVNNAGAVWSISKLVRRLGCDLSRNTPWREIRRSNPWCFCSGPTVELQGELK